MSSNPREVFARLDALGSAKRRAARIRVSTLFQNDPTAPQLWLRMLQSTDPKVCEVFTYLGKLGIARSWLYFQIRPSCEMENRDPPREFFAPNNGDLFDNRYLEEFTRLYSVFDGMMKLAADSHSFPQLPNQLCSKAVCLSKVEKKKKKKEL